MEIRKILSNENLFQESKFFMLFLITVVIKKNKINSTNSAKFHFEGYKMVSPRLCETAKPLFKNPRLRLERSFRLNLSPRLNL